ncbi:MAG: C45 family autoproteolytic acyltransferase/hydolase [Salibacteraceae bacterium]
MHFVSIRTIDLSNSGEKWAQLFKRLWPKYKRWFLREGSLARPGYLTSRTAFEKHFPELLDVYHELCELAGGGDLSSRFLSMYCPQPNMSGCSQVAWSRPPVALVRNYDYSPVYFEGLLVKTNWLKKIIGMSDCTWGLLDGVNEDGLSISLTFGGRKITAEGFGIPLIVRYGLECCATTAEAIEKLLPIPAHMAYNLTLIDAAGNFATIYFHPGEANAVVYDPVGTNHQEQITWPDYAALTQTLERKEYLNQVIGSPDETLEKLKAKFLEPPLYHTRYEKGFGTLYTAAYYPNETKVELLWPEQNVTIEMENFVEQRLKVMLVSDAMRKLSY